MNKPYVSIDLETTGLNPETCQILEIGAIIDDWVSPIEKLPRFHCYVIHKQIKGEPFALAMNAEILRLIANHEVHGHLQFLKPDQVGRQFAFWLAGNGIKGKVLAAGKNFAGFDLPFLLKLSDYDCPFRDSVKFHHRCFDPGSMLFNPKLDLDGPPDTKTCMERCGIPGDVKHTALEDAEAVIKMIRFASTVQWTDRDLIQGVFDRMPGNGPRKLGL